MVPWALIVLTVTTGMVDAISYLRLGHVFVANMTGNVVFLGFALGGAHEISALGSIVAMASFLVGALAGGKLVRQSTSNVDLLLQASIAKFILAFAALVASIFVTVAAATPAGYAITALLALAMGIQNAAVRKMAIPDFTTTVLTLTMTGIAADLTAGTDAKFARRATSIVSMFGGALIGALLVLNRGVTSALVLIVALFALTIAIVSMTQRRQSALDGGFS
jgi:uncharacterized membrane protein YoaK (UPF0700 family)